ncbi:unnamed protein product [Rhizoctonia solani]|uniref:Uncharacterized protein n=1 Tax=Rhizoctonia solani TaxID=456999 RepID=A0A8H2W911_9AGAM|nr:unnamed protein product [Rhizoctonia solani]
MAHIPSNEEILEQLVEIRRTNPGIGINKAVALIKEKNPDWGLAAKRLRNVSKQLEPPSSDTLPGAHNSQPSGPSWPTEESPMSTLMQVLDQFMAGGDRKAAKRAAQIDLSFKMNLGDVKGLMNNPSAFTKMNFSSSGANYPMRSCKLAVTIVLQIVAQNELLYDCIALNSRTLGGLPTVAQIRAQPSASLPIAFARAKEAALKHQKSTAVAVNLIDVEMAERGEGYSLGSLNYMSFSHAFVAFIGPEGMRILQAWGEHGYSLAENIHSPASRLRDWSEAETFVNQYDKLIHTGVTWKPETFEAYKQCFGVDIPKITGPRGPERKSVTPCFRPWTRIKEISDVKTSDIKRWFKVLDAVNKLVK